MKNIAQGYVLKEYGSWSVLTLSFLAGLGVSRSAPWQALPVFVALALLINAKQAYMKWVRRVNTARSLAIFLAQIATASVLLIGVFGRSLPQLLPLLIFPAAYLSMTRLSGEHSLITELLGFCLLSLAAVLAKFLVVEGVDVRLFVATAFYFTAGVFKIKAILLKKNRDRVFTVLHVLLTLLVYQRFHIAWVILIPLVENIVSVVTLYRVPLKTTGWIEVAKSTVFALLLATFF